MLLNRLTVVIHTRWGRFAACVALFAVSNFLGACLQSSPAPKPPATWRGGTSVIVIQAAPRPVAPPSAIIEAAPIVIDPAPAATSSASTSRL